MATRRTESDTSSVAESVQTPPPVNESQINDAGRTKGRTKLWGCIAIIIAASVTIVIASYAGPKIHNAFVKMGNLMSHNPIFSAGIVGGVVVATLVVNCWRRSKKLKASNHGNAPEALTFKAAKASVSFARQHKFNTLSSITILVLSFVIIALVSGGDSTKFFTSSPDLVGGT